MEADALDVEGWDVLVQRLVAVSDGAVLDVEGVGGSSSDESSDLLNT